jgi:choline kinase
MSTNAVILAAGMGTRLGRPWPKPLTPLADGRTIMAQQMDNLHAVFDADLRIMTVVGFKLELILEAFPDVSYVYNEAYDQTNTNRSLLKALVQAPDGGVLWMNGDVVFDPRVLSRALPLMNAGQSFICVNTAAVGEEEVKYTVDNVGNVLLLSKRIDDPLGEAVGINYVSAEDRAHLIDGLRACADDDYFERGLEIAIERHGSRYQPLDISDLFAVEVDFEDDLTRANDGLSAGSGGSATPSGP